MRIDFGGGWTDFPAWAESGGGSVLNVAITQYATGSISRPSGGGILRNLRSDRSYVSYSVDVPPGSGLGARAAQSVLWAALVRSTIENTASRTQIAEIATKVSETLGILGGKQDQYASALGGFNYLTVTDHVTVERLSLEPSLVDALHARLLLVYSGYSDLPPHALDAVWERCREGDARARSALQALARGAGEMRVALLAGDLEAFGSLIDENWSTQKALYPGVTTPEIDELISRARAAGALAAKACGLGGGGCVLLFARAGETSRLRATVESRSTPVIDFDFDTYGVHLRKG
jgi:D-glycero-alpha-D-manno-heptose-7-phosphate kinase